MVSGTAPAESAATSAGARTARRLTVSVAVSALGTWSYNVGIAVYAYQETGSTAWVAAATVGRYVPALMITWVGTRWADVLPRRTVAVGADLLCALIMVALTVVAAVHGSIVLAIALAALSSGIARVQAAMALALAADVVPESMLVRTVATLHSAEAIATAAGPAIAAVVLAWSTPAALFVLNGLTFALSAVMLSGLPQRVESAASASRRERRQPARLDRRLARAVWPLLATRTLVAVVYGVDVVLLAVLATAQLRQQTAGYGWLLAGAGAGGLLAAVVLRRTRAVLGVVASSALGMTLYTLPLLLFLLEPPLPGSLAIQVVRGIGVVVVTTAAVSTLQWTVPSAAASPVFGLTYVLVLAGTSVGALMAPLVLAWWGLTTTIWLAALCPFGLQLLVLPALRRFDREAGALLERFDPRVSALRRLAMFHDASRATLVEVAEGLEEVRVPAGVAVVTQGDESDALYVLVEGAVQVTVAGPDGPVRLRQMDAPSYFGEIGLVHHVPRTASVATVAPSVLWRVPSAVFAAAVGQAGVSGALTETARLRLGVDAAA